jgi:uncharacterized membrane protein YkvI
MSNEKKGLGKVTAFGIGMTFVGVIIGAGFATDQELLQFFGGYGSLGMLGIWIAGAGFAVYSILLMLVARRIGSGDYNLVIVPTGRDTAIGRIFTVVVDIIMIFLMILIFAVMIVGAGAQVNQFFGWSPYVGSIAMVVLAVATVLGGTESFLSSFNIVVPLMVALAVVISVLAVIFVAPSASITDASGYATPNAMVANIPGQFALSAILYVLYNMLGAVATLPQLGVQAKSNASVILGGIIGGGIIALLAAVLYTAVMSNAEAVIQAPMPMLAVAKTLNPVAGGIYMGILFAAIYTTATGFMFGIRARLDNVKQLANKEGTKKIIIAVVAVAALIGNQFGFVSLIGTVYPFFGYVGILILLLLVVNFFIAKKKTTTL